MRALLNESSPPFQVAEVDELLQDIRKFWNLACAWDRLDPHAQTVPDFSWNNPFFLPYRERVERYEQYRREHIFKNP